MRDIINKFGVPIVIGCLVIVAIGYWISVRKATSGPGKQSMGFFVDEETGEESIHPLSELPPLIGKSGNATVVRAMKYSFDNGANPKTVYLMKYTPEAIAEIKSLPEDDPRRPDLFFSGQLVRSPDKESKWVPLRSADGEQIVALPLAPEGKHITLVSPR